MVIEKLLDEERLSESEKQIAHFILDRNNSIDNLTSTELAKRCYTSQATVIRLYKKMGIQTYREFISTLVIERNEYFKNEIFTNIDFKNVQSLDDATKTIVSFYAQTMTIINFLNDRNIMNRVCNKISNVKCIDIYSSDMSRILANELSYKLQAVGKYSICHNGINSMFLDNTGGCRSRLSIIISATPFQNDLLSIAKELHEKDLGTLCICDKSDQDLIHLCQEYLIFDEQNNHYTQLIGAFSLYSISLILFIQFLFLENLRLFIKRV